MEEELAQAAHRRELQWRQAVHDTSSDSPVSTSRETTVTISETNIRKNGRETNIVRASVEERTFEILIFPDEPLFACLKRYDKRLSKFLARGKKNI
jgi:hypothetical protein